MADYIVGPLRNNPYRVGKPLRGDLRGLHSARVSVYRVVSEIDEDRRTVNVLLIDHRANAYRPR